MPTAAARSTYMGFRKSTPMPSKKPSLEIDAEVVGGVGGLPGNVNDSTNVPRHITASTKFISTIFPGVGASRGKRA